MTTLVVLPAYNERLNVVELIGAVLDVDAANEVCIVDDSSPDGTAAALRLDHRTAMACRCRTVCRAARSRT
jgi:glycosyltransferase involved in cell wall biosynthesis